jgi:dipeptidyl-peptidase 4
MLRSIRAGILVVAAGMAAAALVRATPQGPGGAPGLDRLRGMPGVDAYGRMQERLSEAPAFTSGSLNVLWAADSQSFSYARDGRRHRFDIPARRDEVLADGAEGPAREIASGVAVPGTATRRGTPSGDPPSTGVLIPCPMLVVERGRQRACEASPDLTKKAYYRDRNLYVSNADGSAEVAITSDGDERTRIKYGVASWVYGEELEQTTAIWWSPDSRKVAFYRFDESKVRDYYLTRDLTAIQSTVDVEAYPKAGTDNPVADVRVYDVASRQVTTLDVRDGRPFSDEVVGHYVYGITWSPDSREIRLFRADRRQQHLEYAGCSAETSRCRVIVREGTSTGWLERHPTLRNLTDGRRFILASDRTGWRNYFLVDVSSAQLAPITRLTRADAEAIVRVDEAAGVLYYMAHDEDHPLRLQLHRVGLDGRNDVRLTDPRYTHTVSLSPDGTFFVDVYQSHADPPASRLVDATGAVIAELATSDLSRFASLGLHPVEQFSYLAADGRTRLYGSIAFPSTFDPATHYPVLVPVYAGPESDDLVPSERFVVPNPLTEYGFLVVTLQTRAAPGLGRKVLDSLYLKLGQTEVDDLAEGLKALRARPYVDAGRVGIYGTSYGGYAALMTLLRYPDLVDAASVSSAPTDWRHYDTIYTERYMWTPQGNSAGYDKGSAMTYVDRLRGRLLLYYGTADNNVHPSNTLQLLQAFGRVGKSVEVQVGADREHSAVPTSRMMEFFVENLIVRPERLLAPPASPARPAVATR